MTLFDLLFLFAALATLVSLATAAALALAGRRRTSYRVLRGLGLTAAGYLGLGLAVSFLRPQRVLSVGEPWCFDDWCLTVERVGTSAVPAGLTYTTDLRLSSRARGVSQRARGAWIYLIDGRGQRYPPAADSSTIPLDTLLGPGQSVTASRSFLIPAGIRPVGLVTGHGGPYCGPMSFLIIGSSACLFGKPTMVRIP